MSSRIKIIKGSPLASQIWQLQWKPDENGFLKENKAQANHSTDCLIYGHRLISVLFESGVLTRDSKPQPTHYLDPSGLGETGSSGSDEFAGLLADPDFADDGWGNA